MDDLTDADLALLSDLRDALDRHDPPPTALVEAARNSLGWLDVDTALAELVADSGLAGAPAVRTAVQPPRVLTFEAAGTTLVVELLTDSPATHRPSCRRAIGQLLPAGAADVQIRASDGGIVEVRADGDGRFRASDLPAGPLAFACTFDEPGRQPFATRWTTD